MSSYDLDLFVIGAGSGGVRAARIAATYGARVAIAEESRVGGTCVIRGCVPKKLYVYASRYKKEFETARGFGWRGIGQIFDWRALSGKVSAEVSRLEGIYSRNLQNAGVRLINSRAVVEGPHTVRLLDSGERISAGRILISTGAKPSFPPDIPGSQYAMTSDDVFNLQELPQRILIVGGGYIAIEFAGVFANLGVNTTLVHHGEKVLRGFDMDLRDEIQSAYQAQGIELLLQRKVLKMARDTATLAVYLSDGSVREVDAVLFATGRVPNSSGIGLVDVGVKMDARGRIEVDEEFRTAVPSIFAVGDVCNTVNLTPVAIREGHAFADRQFGMKEVSRSESPVPTAVFSNPEIGTVGPSEDAARAQYPELKVFRTRFRPMKYTLAGQDSYFFMKLLVDGATDKVIGAHLAGEGASEMIQLIGVAITAGATKADFDRTVAVHPTIAEELVTMRG